MIDRRAYEHNLKTLAAGLTPGCRICAVLKADAYGHGLDLLAPAAVAAGADVIGITDNWEAELVRRLNLQVSLLRLRPSTAEEAAEAREWRVEEVIGSLEQAKALSRAARDGHHNFPVHLKLDVGIGRMGFSLPAQWNELQEACRLEGIQVRGVMTHFPCADEAELGETRAELERFQRDARRIQASLPDPLIRHAANSAASLRLPDSHQEMARLGIVTYGLAPSPEVPLSEALRPVMRWISHVAQVRVVPAGSTIGYGMTVRLDRDRRIATLPAGYADGYQRAFSNRAEVVIRGVRCPVVGRVSMDLTTVDVTHVPEVQPGDEVVLIGRQGREQITADDLARWAGTINYEIACLVGKCNRAWRRAESWTES
ncbi:MAG: alanine racemase [bacterium]